MKHIVALSGGKDSTAMALRLREVEPETDFIFVCTPTGRELPTMFAHWRNIGDLLGKRILPITAGFGWAKMCADHKALPNWRMRFCTPQMKLVPYQQFMFANAPAVSYVGLRADEETREGDRSFGEAGGEVYGSVQGVVQRFPLREWGWGEKDVWAYLNERGVEIPKRTDCGMCFFQRLGEWHDLWREFPDLYAEYEAEEKAFGHTYRSPGRDTWPASLEGLRERFEKGDIPRGAGADLRTDTRQLMCRACRL